MSHSHDTVDRYFQVWNETNPHRRHDLIEETWAADGHYIDPLNDAAGRDAIDTMVAGFHQEFPGLVFRRIGEVETHHDRIRFSWDVAPKGGERVAAGTDIAVVTPDGLLRDVTGFFDVAPVMGGPTDGSTNR